MFDLKACSHAVPTAEHSGPDGMPGLMAFHKVQAIADTYGVTKQAVTGRIQREGLPHLRIMGRWLYVSDEHLRAWIAEGATFAHGVPATNRTIQLACGWTVTDVPPLGIKKRVPSVRMGRPARCLHQHKSGPLHSIVNVARTLGKPLDEIFGLSGGERVQVTTKIYLTDSAIRERLGVAPGTRLACGWAIG